jgi:hypothetical protein
MALRPNAEVLDMQGTYYQVDESGYLSTILVPVGGGPYNLDQVLVGTPPSPAAQYVVAPASISVAGNGTVAGIRPELNVVAGTNIAVTAVDNPGASRIDVTIDAAGGGGGTPSNIVIAETSYGQASSAGAANAYSRGDHAHGSPSLTGVAPATTEGIGQTAAVGTATAPARADHVHPLAAAGAPTASAVADTSSTGSATTFATSDHRHAREAFAAPTPQTS